MKRLAWPFLIAGTIVMIYVMMLTGHSLETKATPLGIINLETAANQSSVISILDVWKQSSPVETDNIAVAKNNTYLDFLFIAFYVLFLFSCCKKITLQYRYSSFMFKAGNLAGTSIISAGILDIWENLGMLQSLNGHITDNMILFTATCSLAKWTLVAITILYLLLALLISSFKKNE